MRLTCGKPEFITEETYQKHSPQDNKMNKFKFKIGCFIFLH